MHSTYRKQFVVQVALAFASLAAAHAEDPPADVKASAAGETKAAAEAVKRDAQLVGSAVKDGAQKVGVAAKEVALEVADAAQKGAHEVAAAAKSGVAKTKAAVSGNPPGKAAKKPNTKPKPEAEPDE